MRPQRLPETVGTERRASEVVRRAHSKPSDRWRRTPDGRARRDDAAARRDGGGQKTEVADDRHRPMRGGSSPRGTGEPCLGDTGELSLRAYGGFAGEHRATAARSGADMLSLGRTPQHHRRHGPRHPANVATRQWWSPATRPTWHCNHQYAIIKKTLHPKFS